MVRITPRREVETHSKVRASYVRSLNLSNHEPGKYMDGWRSFWDCSETDPWPCPAELHATCISMVPDSVKKAGVCAVMSMWLVHIKDYLWTVGFSSNQGVSNSSGVRWTGYDGKMQNTECTTWGNTTVCSPGSWYMRRWLPLTKDWHSQKGQNQRKL